MAFVTIIGFQWPGPGFEKVLEDNLLTVLYDPKVGYVTGSTQMANQIRALADAYDPRPFEKARLIARVEEIRDAKMGGGLMFDFGEPYGSLTVQTRDFPHPDRQNLATMLQVAMGYCTGLIPGDGPMEQMNPFRTAENVMVPLRAQQVMAMCLNVQSRLGAMLKHSFALKDQIANTQQLENLYLIDLDNGWPF